MNGKTPPVEPDDGAAEDNEEWTSEGFSSEEAAKRWRNYFAGLKESPVEITLHSQEPFAAQLVSRGVGQLRLLHLIAPPQKVVHREIVQDLAASDHLIHLIYAVRGAFHAQAEGYDFHVEAGESALIDNSNRFELDMYTQHEAVDLIMPYPWLAQFLPDPMSYLGKAFPMDRGWAPPLAAMLLTIAREGDNCPQPRTLVAEQLGHMIALALGVKETITIRPRARLAQQIMRRIESDYADPELSPEGVAADLRISKRYLQALLTNAGTSFVRELTAVRLDKASALLTDPTTKALSVAEVAYRCGFLDPGYFARQFRKRFNATPRMWRELA